MQTIYENDLVVFLSFVFEDSLVGVVRRNKDLPEVLRPDSMGGPRPGSVGGRGSAGMSENVG